MKSNKSAPIDGLTTLRFFAALMVVFYHVWGYFLPLKQASWFYGHVVHAGYIGVNFFFILSGYILSYVYIGDSEKPRIEKTAFWKSRFARIYPLYVLSFALEIPLFIQDVIFRQNHLKEAAVGGATLLANLLFLQSWFPDLRWWWNFCSWTLSTEAFFYLGFPFLAAWLWKRTRNQNLPLIMLGVYLLLMTPAVFLWVTRSNFNESSFEWIYMNPILRLPEFALGMLLFRRQKLFSDSSRGKNDFSLLFIGLGVLLPLIGFAVFDLVPVFVWRSGILDPAFMCLIAGVAIRAEGPASLLSAWPLVLLGEASYAVYIFQAPVREWFVVMAHHLRISNLGTDDHPILLGGYLLTLIGGSLLSYQYFETPLREKIRKVKINFSRQSLKRT